MNASAAPGDRPGALSGVRVIDFSRVFAGPHCARMLADMGADVIKVEAPGGDLARSFPKRQGHLSLYYLQQNAGKRNVSIDLHSPEGAELAARLAIEADVVVENFRPGVMAGFGLDFASLSPRNPRLVYGSISGYGQKGPWQRRRAYAPVIHAEMGVTDIHARRFGEDRPFEAFSHADAYAALECLAGILAALYRREQTGRGQHVDVAMAAALLSVNDRAATELATDDVERYDREAVIVVRTSSGALAVISGDPVNDAVFAGYCTVMDRPDLRFDPRFCDRAGRARHRDELTAAIQQWVSTFVDTDLLEAALGRIRLPMGVVRSVKEAAVSEWADAWGAFAEVSDRQGGTARIPQSPWRFSEASAGIRGSAAFPGEHNAEVLEALLGLSAGDVARLEEEGVLRSRLPDNLVREPIPGKVAAER